MTDTESPCQCLIDSLLDISEKFAIQTINSITNELNNIKDNIEDQNDPDKPLIQVTENADKVKNVKFNKKKLAEKNHIIKYQLLCNNDTYDPIQIVTAAQVMDNITSNEVDIVSRVFGGDFLSANSLKAVYGGIDMALSANLLKYDVIGIGNHEMDDTIELSKFLIRLLKAKIVCSNMRLSDANLLGIKENHMLYDGDIRIGYISYLTQSSSNIAGAARNILFDDFPTMLSKQKEFINSCDYYVLGFHENVSELELLKKPEYEMYTDKLLCVITGHEHISYNEILPRRNSSVGIPVVQAGADGKYVGNINLTLDIKNKKVNESKSEIIDVASAKPVLNSERLEFQNIITKTSKQILDIPLGLVKDYPLVGSRSVIRSQGSNLCTFVCDSARFGIQKSTGVPLSNIFFFQNTGSIRNDSVIAINTNLTIRDVNLICPFVNSIVTISVSNIVELKNLITKIQQKNLTKKGTGGLLVTGSNLSLDYANGLFTLPNESEIDLTKPILGGVLLFTANGGDGWTEFKDGFKVINTEIDAQDSLKTFITTPKSLGGLERVISYLR